MSSYRTVFGSLENYEKGGVEIIDDDPKNYAFSNVFEVASKSKPYEKVAVGQNLKYVIEAVRAEGDSPWYTAAHDESALVMDGVIEVHYIKPETPLVADGTEGTVKLDGAPNGRSMGWVKAGRGHMALLPKGSAYQFRNPGKPGVILVQTIKGPNTIERWAEICQTKP
jgi:mannose-6-phosphate isomerase-like protein (cupin superfamily)